MSLEEKIAKFEKITKKHPWIKKLNVFEIEDLSKMISGCVEEGILQYAIFLRSDVGAMQDLSVSIDESIAQFYNSRK